MKVSSNDLDDLERRIGRELPTAYRHHVESEGVGQLDTVSEDYIELWDPWTMIGIAELPEVRDRFPELVRFGGDGSREQLAFDYRTNPPRVVLLDITAEEESSLVEQGRSFEEFVARARTDGLFRGA